MLPFDGGADFIAIASNAVNCRFSADGSPRIGIVEATCQQVQQLGVCRIGLLASTATVSSRGYEVEFAAAGIEVVTPGAGDQEVVEQVVGALNGWPSVMPDRVAFLRVLADLSNEVDAVVLGSTHLREILGTESVGKPVVDSAEALADACCRILLNPAPLWLLQQRLSGGPTAVTTTSPVRAPALQGRSSMNCRQPGTALTSSTAGGFADLRLCRNQAAALNSDR